MFCSTRAELVQQCPLSFYSPVVALFIFVSKVFYSKWPGVTIMTVWFILKAISLRVTKALILDNHGLWQPEAVTQLTHTPQRQVSTADVCFHHLVQLHILLENLQNSSSGNAGFVVIALGMLGFTASEHRFSNGPEKRLHLRVVLNPELSFKLHCNFYIWVELPDRMNLSRNKYITKAAKYTVLNIKYTKSAHCWDGKHPERRSVGFQLERRENDNHMWNWTTHSLNRHQTSICEVQGNAVDLMSWVHHWTFKSEGHKQACAIDMGGM